MNFLNDNMSKVIAILMQSYINQIITTPKKAKYQLRNRVVLAPGSGSSPLIMDPLVDISTSPQPVTSPGPTSNTEEEDGMQEMEMPQEMFEEQIEGLTTEIQAAKVRITLSNS